MECQGSCVRQQAEVKLSLIRESLGSGVQKPLSDIDE